MSEGKKCSQLISTTISKHQREFEIPEWKSIFPHKCHEYDSEPFVGEVIESIKAFVGDIPLKKFKKILVCSKYTSYLFSKTLNTPRYKIALKVTMLIFTLDDHTECKWGDVALGKIDAKGIWRQIEEGLDRVMGATNVSMIEWKPYVFLMYALHEDICRTFDDIQRRRFFKEWKFYTEKNIEETLIVSKDKEFQSVEEVIRMGSGATRIGIQFIEYLEDIRLNEEEWEDPVMQEMLDMSALAVMYANDVWSFEKEFNEQNRVLRRTCNVVALTAALEDIPIKDAMETTLKKTTEYELKTEELIMRLESDPDISEDKKRFLQSCRYFIGGSWFVCTIIDRYSGRVSES